MKKKIVTKFNIVLFAISVVAMLFCAFCLIVTHIQKNNWQKNLFFDDGIVQRLKAEEKNIFYDKKELNDGTDNTEIQDDSNQQNDDDLNTDPNDNPSEEEIENQKIGKTIKIEYLTYSQNGQYEIYEDYDLVNFFAYGDDTTIISLDSTDYTFVGWFGYDETSDIVFDKDGVEYNSIFDENLNLTNSVFEITENVLEKIVFFEVPVDYDGVETFGKLTLKAKCKINFGVLIEGENQNYEFAQDVFAGIVSVDDVFSDDESLFAIKSVDVGSSLEITISPNQNYLFLGFYVKEENEYKQCEISTQFDIENNVTVANIECVDFDTQSLIARFVYNSNFVSLNKLLIDENNSNQKISIEKNNEYIIDAKIYRDGLNLTGVENLNYHNNNLILRYNEIVELQLNPDINYHIIDNVLTKTSLLDAESDILATYQMIDNKYVLTLQNKSGVGIFDVTLHFQKSFSTATLVFGTVTSPNNFVGGDTEFCESSTDEYGNIVFGAFDFKTNKQTTLEEEKIISKTASVYFTSDIEIRLNTAVGYKFDSSYSTITYVSGLDVNFEYVYTGSVITGIKIYNIIDDIEINIVFLKQYEVKFEVNSIVIGGVPTKIGQIKVESDDYTSEDIIKYVDGGASINFRALNLQNNNNYIFKSWEIRNKDGNEILYRAFGINPDNLSNYELTLKYIYEDLFVTAIYERQTYLVRIVWNGQNGDVEVLENYEKKQDDYILGYGDTITVKLTPLDAKYIIGDTYVQSGKSGTRNDFEGYSTFRVSNITKDEKIVVSFVTNTWWLHLTTKKFEGKGTADSPYMIKDASDLALVGYVIENEYVADEGNTQYSKAYYQLKNDIEMGDDYFFVPIGSTERPFAGTFDYNYYAIDNLLVEDTTKEYINDGLFDKVDGTAKIIRRYRSKTPLIVGLSAIGFVILTAFLIVVKIETKRQRPKKVFVLQVDDKGNYVEKK